MNGTWQRIDIAGKPADVYELASGVRPSHGLLFLHPVGLETLVGDDAYTRLFDELRLVCVSPHGQRSWWSDRICPEFDPRLGAEAHLLLNVVPFFHGHWELTPPAIGLFGISMGGQGALRLAFKHSSTFPVVAGISSAIEYHQLYGYGTPIDEMYDSKEQCRQDTALLHIHPSRYPEHIYFCVDPTDGDWWRGNDRLHEKLAALGIAHTCDLTTRAGGHSWNYFDAMAEPAIRFLHAGLGAQAPRVGTSLRLV